jgi:hypothetical protein
MKHNSILIFFILIFNVLAQAAPLTGTKTIGGLNPDYVSFTAAITALSTEGVGPGGVTFLVAPGIYNETLVIEPVTGAGPSSRVVFQADSGVVAIHSVGTSGLNSAITLQGADYLTFDGININNGGTSSANHCEVGFNFATSGTDDGSSFNIIQNCTINMKGGAERPTLSRGISTSFTSINSATGNSSNNVFRNIAFNGSEMGIHLAGAYFLEAENNEVSNCTFGISVAIGNHASGASGLGYAIFAVDQKGCRFFNNTIDSVRVTNTAASGGAIGIYLYRTTGDVHANKINHIHHSGTSVVSVVSGIYAGANFSGSLRIFNNMIRGLSSDYSGAASNIVSFSGMVSVNSTTAITAPVYWYFNTAELSNAGPKNYSSAAMVISASNLNHTATVKNNILVNHNVAASASNFSFALCDFNTSALKLTSDYNDLYVSGAGSYIGWSSVNNTFSSTLAAWKTNTGKDQNSVSVLPVFADPADLHLDTVSNPLLSNAGTPIAGIAGDADFTVRSLIAPEIGADELCTGIALIPEISITSDIGPEINEGEAVEFSAVLNNAGPAPQFEWMVNGIPTGSVSATYTTSTLLNGDQVSCRLVSSLECASSVPVFSDTITMTVYSILPEVTILEYYYIEYGEHCFNAIDTIITAGNFSDFVVYGSASVNLIAGERILMRPGTVVYAGGYLHARIAPAGPFCNNAIIAPPANKEVLTAVSDSPESPFRLWPNPTDGVFSVSIPGEMIQQECMFTVYDIQGQTVASQTVKYTNNVKFDLSGHPAGLYMLTCRSGDSIYSVKFVKK